MVEVDRTAIWQEQQDKALITFELPIELRAQPDSISPPLLTIADLALSPTL